MIIAVEAAAASSATTYTSFWNAVVRGKPLLNGRVSRKAKRIWMPVCATRSSCSRSAKFRSQRCFSSSWPRWRFSRVMTPGLARVGDHRNVAGRTCSGLLRDQVAHRLLGALGDRVALLVALDHPWIHVRPPGHGRGVAEPVGDLLHGVRDGLLALG